MKADNITAVKMYHDVKFDEFQHGGWNFMFTNSGMFNTTDLDMLQDALTLQGIPDITNGNNCGLIYNKKYNFGFHVNAKDALYFCNYAHRTTHLLGEHGKTNHVNHISHKPVDVKLKMSDKWKANENNDIKTLDKISDTFYSSPYKGTVVNMEQIQYWFKKFEEVKGKSIFEQQLDEQRIKSEMDYLGQVFSPSAGMPYSEKTDEQIPLNKLTPDNPIVWASHTILYEDELGDNGLSTCEFRFRVMKDCFFGLLRSYLRVDDVVIRLLDTRIFHEFGKSYILREFMQKEDSWENIKNTGFVFTPQWSVDPQQSFMIQNHVKVQAEVRDKIYFQ